MLNMSDITQKSPFVQRLEEEMLRRGIPDRAALGRDVGIPYHRLNPWWIRIKSKPNAADLLALAKFFDVSETYLLSGGPRKPFSRMASLLQRAESLDPQLQDELEIFLDFLEARRSSSEKA